MKNVLQDILACVCVRFPFTWQILKSECWTDRQVDNSLGRDNTQRTGSVVNSRLLEEKSIKVCLSPRSFFFFFFPVSWLHKNSVSVWHLPVKGGEGRESSAWRRGGASAVGGGWKTSSDLNEEKWNLDKCRKTWKVNQETVCARRAFYSNICF